MLQIIESIVRDAGYQTKPFGDGIIIYKPGFIWPFVKVMAYMEHWEGVNLFCVFGRGRHRAEAHFLAEEIGSAIRQPVTIRHF